jgi:hypothetical protein
MSIKAFGIWPFKRKNKHEEFRPPENYLSGNGDIAVRRYSQGNIFCIAINHNGKHYNATFPGSENGAINLQGMAIACMKLQDKIILDAREKEKENTKLICNNMTIEELQEIIENKRSNQNVP